MFTDISEELKVNLGVGFMNLLKESCKELIYTARPEDNKTYLYVTFDQEFHQEIYVKSIKPIFLPMIARPLLWSKKNNGGYISDIMNNYANPENQIIKSNPKVISNSKISQKQIDCINYMNNVPFKINTDVLHYLLIEWEKEESKLFKGLNNLHPKTELVKDKNYKMDSLLFKEIQSHNSMHYHFLSTLMIANLYKDQLFYIPTFLDFRGRLYSKVSYLSYQGGDMARSLIQFYSPNDNIFVFKKSKNPINIPINFLKQYAGNVYNLSKKTMAIKIKWCNKFIEDLKTEFGEYYINNISNLSKISSKEKVILSGAKEDETGMTDSTLEALTKAEQDFDFYFLNKYLDNAEEPFQFISVYFSIKDIFIKKQYNINIPILFDASCSGVQHLASLANDLEVAKMVNVVSTEQARNDFYQIAANFVVDYINNMDLNNEIKEKLKLIKVTRSILKVPIMTISYNVGLEKMSKGLLNEMGKLVEIDNLIVKENREDINISLPMDSLDLGANPISLKGLSADKEQKLENSYANKTFKIKINKEHSKIEEDLFLSPKE